MKNEKKVEKKLAPLYARVIAGSMAALLLAGTIFGLLLYLN